MTEFAITVFRLTNQRGYFVPCLNIGYLERDTGLEWRITCGGTRAYFVRFGSKVSDNTAAESADSHFMANRVTGSLLMAGAGLFQPEAMGRLFFRGVEGAVTWTSQLDVAGRSCDKEPCVLVERVYDWYKAICDHKLLRRAVDDAHLALSHSHEALIFVYRGLEWLKLGQGIEWAQLANDMGGTEDDLRELKKTANYETGVRHATPSGSKMRALADNYGTWVCGLIDAINAARSRLDPAFKRMGPDEVGNAVLKAMPVVPYP